MIEEGYGVNAVVKLPVYINAACDDHLTVN
jgi:hypothetical protein